MKKTQLVALLCALPFFSVFSQTTTIYSDDFETPQTWTIFEEIVANNTCYAANIGEVAPTTETTHNGSKALRVWSNKVGAQKSNHVIAAHHISTSSGITGHLKYGMWVNSATTLGLTQSSPEFSVQSTRTVGSQNLTYIAGIQYIGNQWITDKWNVWHNGVWQPIKFSEFGTTLVENTWYYLELEFDMTTNEYIALKIQGGGINQTLNLKQTFQNAPTGFKIGAETRNWTPSLFVTAESENLWTGCASVTDNKVFYDDLTLQQIAVLAPTTCEQLVWSDEFNGSSLDLTKWTPIVGPGGVVAGNGELQYYTARPQNTQVSNGILKIIALAETNYNGSGNDFTSARMQTKDLGDWRYGRIEARIKLPVAQGMWPAFWLLPTDNIYGIWPRSGEIDIMELIGREPSRTYATIHTSSDATVHSFGGNKSLTTGTFADDFHVFSVNWAPNLIQFYLDGVLYATQTNTTVSPYPWVFDKRFYVLLNLAIGGNWAGSPDATTTFPQVMEVDYVRVYQQIGDVSIVGKTLVEPNTASVAYTVPNLPNLTYQWSVTGLGNSIAAGQNTAQASVNWGNNNGVVSVAITDGCTPSANLVADVTVSPNLWSNYGFEQNYVAWETRPDYGTTAVFSVSNSQYTEGSRSACVQTNTANVAEPWAIQLSRTNLNLTGGTGYTLRFKAKADAAHSIPISFIRPVVFSTVAGSSAYLTTNWQQFSMTFTPTNNETVMFNADLAGQLGTVCFDDFVFARTSVLAVELLDFTGQIVQSSNQLTYQYRATDDKITVEKSKDGVLFTELTALATTSKSGEVITATTTDNTPFDLTYYRLRMTERTGKTTFSKIISLKNTFILRGPKIYPNPANDVLFIENADSDISIVNVLGQVVLSLSKNINHPPLSIYHLKSGVYFVKIGGEMVRFVKN
jgi:beta-glucanase (GH16 family)